MPLVEDYEPQAKFVLPFLPAICDAEANADVFRPASTTDLSAGVINERKRLRSSMDSSTRENNDPWSWQRVNFCMTISVIAIV